jgi:predicted nucleic acid-binding protein
MESARRGKTLNMQHATRVYTDASVFGGAFDDEFREASNAFFIEARSGRLTIVISGVVLDEIALAPRNVRTLLEELTPLAELTHVTDDALRLQEAYLVHGIVGESCSTDALHVALATAADCDLIVSWNFKHIVNLRRIRLYNAVNALHGYNQIEIRSPREVTGEGSEA